VPEVPLVLSDAAESVKKTSKALEVLKKIGAIADVEKARDSKNVRRGKGEAPRTTLGLMVSCSLRNWLMGLFNSLRLMYRFKGLS
jgi:ribosomal protein L4